MKKLMTIFSAAVILLAGACNKDADTKATVTTGSWKLGSTSYDIKYSVRTTTSQGETLVLFYDAAPTSSGFAPTVNSLALSFRTAPNSSGTYQLVSTAGTSTGNQFQISAGGPAGSYAYLGANTNFDITVTGGKAKFTIPDVSMKATGSGPNVTLSGTVQEL